MRAFLLASALIAAATVPASSAAISAEPANPPRQSAQNEKICEDIVVTGSRLAKKRFCGTRAEWEDKRLRDRQLIEEIQRSPCVVTKSGGNQNACVPG